MRMPTGEVIVTPSGMIYDDMVPEDMLENRSRDLVRVPKASI